MTDTKFGPLASLVGADVRESQPGLPARRYWRDMTDNEIIAKWAGFTKLDKPEPITLSWAPGHCDMGPTLHHWRDPEGTYWIDAPEYSRDITLWHGQTGLLKLIEDRGIQRSFINRLVWMLAGQSHTAPAPYIFQDEVWQIRCASAAELSAALVAVIKEET